MHLHTGMQLITDEQGKFREVHQPLQAPLLLLAQAVLEPADLSLPVVAVIQRAVALLRLRQRFLTLRRATLADVSAAN